MIFKQTLSAAKPWYLSKLSLQLNHDIKQILSAAKP